jgi:hypothetical protein
MGDMPYIGVIGAIKPVQHKGVYTMTTAHEVTIKDKTIAVTARKPWAIDAIKGNRFCLSRVAIDPNTGKECGEFIDIEFTTIYDYLIARLNNADRCDEIEQCLEIAA